MISAFFIFQTARDHGDQEKSLCKNQAQCLLLAWMRNAGFASHQISSYNRFLEVKLQEIITENSLIAIDSERTGTTCKLTFLRTFIRSPAIREADGSYHRVTPHECRLRGLSYNVSVYVNIRFESTSAGPEHETVVKEFQEVLLCKIPCMVGCSACSLQFGDIGECPLDPGAYFIVNGNEKSVVAQEKMRTNFIFVRRTQPHALTAEIRSLHSTKTRSTSTLIVTLSTRAGLRGETFTINLPFVDMAVPAGVLFKLLGFDALSSIVTFIRAHSTHWSDSFSDLVSRALDTVMLEESREALIEFLGRGGTKEATVSRRVRYIEHILSNEFLPHQGLDSSMETQQRKATYLATVLLKLLAVHRGDLPEDDRDDYSLKRIETTGGLFALLFRQLYRQYLKMLGLQMTRIADAGKQINVMEVAHANRPSETKAVFRCPASLPLSPSIS